MLESCLTQEGGDADNKINGISSDQKIWQGMNLAVLPIFLSFDAGKILRAGVDPGFFLRGGVPLRNGITKNIDTKKKTFDQAIT